MKCDICRVLTKTYKIKNLILKNEVKSFYKDACENCDICDDCYFLVLAQLKREKHSCVKKLDEALKLDAVEMRRAGDWGAWTGEYGTNYKELKDKLTKKLGVFVHEGEYIYFANFKISNSNKNDKKV